VPDDKRLNLLPRLAECFLDGRNENMVDHSVQEMLSQRIYGLALGYEDINDRSNCGGIQPLAFWQGGRNWMNR
jgi:hypothetical protein